MKDLSAVRFFLIGVYLRWHSSQTRAPLSQDMLQLAIRRLWPDMTTDELTSVNCQQFIGNAPPLSVESKPGNFDSLTPFIFGVLDQGECSLADIYRCSSSYWPRITIGMVKDHLEVMAATELLSVDRVTLLDDLIYKIHPEIQDV